MEKHFRIIGDCHGYYRKYVDLAKEAKYSLCVGDVGFEYDYLTVNLDSNFHKFVGGNHDNYTKEKCSKCSDGCEFCENRGFVFTKLSPHFLSDFGVLEIPDFGSIFYVRGAWSIDAKLRIPNVSWWEDEELTYQQCINAIAKYKEVKPDFVVAHTAPTSIIPNIPFDKSFGNTLHKNRTESMLEEMYSFHQPKKWIFGHWHTNWRQDFTNTEFICINELGFLDFAKRT